MQWWQGLILSVAAVLLLVQVGGWLYRRFAPESPPRSAYERVRQLQLRVHSGRSISDQELEFLLSSLKSDDSLKIARALSALTHLKDQHQIVKALPAIRECTRHKKAVVRVYAARAIQQLGTKKEVEFLKPLLSDPDLAVRQMAQQAISALEHKQPEKRR